MPNVILHHPEEANEALNVNAPTVTSPSACTPSWWKSRCRRARPARGQVRGQRRHGEEAAGERAPDARHAVHRDGADRVVDADPLDEQHADDGDHARDERR